MKCKDCTMECKYRTSDGEKECQFQTSMIQISDEWQGVRIQAAIAAMQAIIQAGVSFDLNGNAYVRKDGCNLPSSYATAKNAVEYSDALIEELKKK